MLLAGCARGVVRPFDTERARPATPSPQHASLEHLPPPSEKIVVAVYGFRDQTGQYEPKERGSTFSTAVTQGATSILVSALKTSSWFVPIERKGLSNLLNERDIIRSIRSQHDGETANSLPALLYAGVVLEGGIVGYDTNVITGGSGFRLFGIGGSTEYRQDQVTIYLRAVSTKSGRVLASVNTTKTVVSQKLDGGAFRFVDTDALLETEVGVTYNEPPLLAVKEAVDEAVQNLIVDGVKKDVWTFAASDSASHGRRARRAIRHYERAQARAARTDYFDRLQRPGVRPGLALEVGGGGLKYQGDFRNPQSRPAASFALRQPLAPRWVLGVTGGYGAVAAKDAFDRDVITAEVQSRYLFLPKRRVTPFLQASAGVLSQSPHTFAYASTLFPTVGGDVGVEAMASDRLGVSVSAGSRFALDDALDGATVGRYTDRFWRLRVGLTYYTSLF